MKEEQICKKNKVKEDIQLENNLKELQESLNNFAQKAKDMPECSIKVFIDE